MENTIAFGVPSFVFFIMRLQVFNNLVVTIQGFRKSLICVSSLNSGWALKKFRFEDYLMCVTFVSLLIRRSTPFETDG